MKTSIQRFFFLTLLATFFVCGTSAFAEDFTGTYRSGADGKAADKLYTVKKIDADKYTINTDDWQSTVYYDKQAKTYKGVFRYNDFAPVAGNEFTKGGSKENAVGFHIYKVTENGGILVTFQWERAARDGQGTFKLERVK